MGFGSLISVKLAAAYAFVEGVSISPSLQTILIILLNVSAILSRVYKQKRAKKRELNITEIVEKTIDEKFKTMRAELITEITAALKPSRTVRRSKPRQS